MKLTRSMRRCLILLDRSGEAVRVWSGKRGHEWSWRINNTPMTQPVDRCLRAGLLDIPSRDRVVLSPLGQRVLREVLELFLLGWNQLSTLLCRILYGEPNSLRRTML